jgi:hypothetical protein
MDDVCAHCARESKINADRTATSKCQVAEAEKMLNAARVRYREVNVGDNVLMRPSKEDRGKGDPRGFLAVVLEKVDGFFKLGTRAGVSGQN